MILKLGPLEWRWGGASPRRQERQVPPESAAGPRETYQRGEDEPLKEAVSAQAPQEPPPDESLVWARQAVGSMGLPLRSHKQLAHNLAFRARKLSDATRQELLSAPPGLLSAQELTLRLFSDETRPTQDFRQANKLERDLESPYSDHAVETRLNSLEAQLQEFLRQHGADQFWVAGSLLNGSFGANSDLDVVVPGQTPKSDRRKDLQVLGSDAKLEAFLGEMRQVDTASFLAGKVRLADLRT